MKEFGKNIRSRAKLLGLSDAEVARRSGLSPRRYSFYVTSDREPDLKTLVRICDVLGITVDEALKQSKSKRLSSRETNLERLKLAALELSDEQLEMIAICAEAIYGSGSKIGPKK